jgi:hypothetical protein
MNASKLSTRSGGDDRSVQAQTEAIHKNDNRDSGSGQSLTIPQSLHSFQHTTNIGSCDIPRSGALGKCFERLEGNCVLSEYYFDPSPHYPVWVALPAAETAIMLKALFRIVITTAVVPLTGCG